VLKALELYLTEVNPRYFSNVKKAKVFDRATLKSSEVTPEEKVLYLLELTNKAQAYFGMKAKAAEMGVDSGPIEKEIQGKL
jgi:hypothetical protein